MISHLEFALWGQPHADVRRRRGQSPRAGGRRQPDRQGQGQGQGQGSYGAGGVEAHEPADGGSRTDKAKAKGVGEGTLGLDPCRAEIMCPCPCPWVVAWQGPSHRADYNYNYSAARSM